MNALHPIRLLLPLLGALLLCAPVSAQTAQPFAAEIAAFEKADAEAPPARGGVLFIGSSSVRMWTTLAQDFPGRDALNRGFGGSKVAQSTLYADRIVFPYAPRMIFFYAGDNDIADGASPEQVLADFRQFAETVHARLPETKIVFLSIKPSIARWKLWDRMDAANRLVRDYTRTSDRLGFINVAALMLGADGKPDPALYGPDGLHMTPAGYALWRAAVIPHLATR